MSEPGGVPAESLAVRARDGDESAFAELVRRYQDAVFRLALRITGNRTEAEDAAQEAFLRAYRALPRFDPGRPFGPWLLKIAANRALSRAGRQGKTAPLDAAPEPVEEEGTVTKGLEREEELKRLREAMGELEPMDRAVLALRYEEGLPLARIAETLGIREGAAKVRLFRARQRLMGVLGEEEP